MEWAVTVKAWRKWHSTNRMAAEHHTTTTTTTMTVRRAGADVNKRFQLSNERTQRVTAGPAQYW